MSRRRIVILAVAVIAIAGAAPRAMGRVRLQRNTFRNAVTAALKDGDRLPCWAISSTSSSRWPDV